MNSKLIASAVVALAALSGANAFAQSNLTGEAASVVSFATTTSNTSRAQVQGEYIQARQVGNVAVSNEGAFAVAPVTATSVSRAEVRADAVKAHQLDGRIAG